MGNDLKAGLEHTVIELLDAHSQSGVNQTHMLLMLSLVNIMGIVDILKSSTSGEGANMKLQRGESSEVTNGMDANTDLMNLVQQAAAGQLDPVQLLGMLNQPAGQMPNPAALMGMLSQMMPPPPQPPQPPQPERKQPPQPPAQPQYYQPAQENTQPSIVTDKEYKLNLKQDNKEQDNNEQHQKGYLKWDPRLG